MYGNQNDKPMTSASEEVDSPSPKRTTTGRRNRNKNSESPMSSPLKQPRCPVSYSGYNASYQPPSRQDILGKPIEIIPDKLYWVSDVKPPQNYKNAFFFNIDNDLTYFPFNKDFGPLNLAMVHRFSRELARLLRDKNFQENKIFHYCSSTDPGDKIVNGAFLMGAFMIIILKMRAEDAYAKFEKYHPIFRHYRDASKGECFYNCTLFHCLQGLEYAVRFGWYDFRTFNVKEYEYYERVENGDLNWIIPGKFVAFMGPIENRDAQHRYGQHPRKYIDIFKNIGVTKVIRLNDVKYDRTHFQNAGISHDDLFFIDGSNPPEKIVNEFFNIVEDHFSKPNHGAIAIHCKAGLGRTGTLIGLWAMKHFQIPAESFIGWIRIARPGSILGPQQFYLPQMEPNYIQSQHSTHKGRLATQKLNESPQDKHKAIYGESQQASYLIGAKERNSATKGKRALFNDRTNNNANRDDLPQTSAFDAPSASPQQRQKIQDLEARISNYESKSSSPNSPLKTTYDYRI